MFKSIPKRIKRQMFKGKNCKVAEDIGECLYIKRRELAF
jgi:hypothetical protein